MDAETRAHKIVSFGNAPALLADTLQHFPRAMWQFTPAPDQWSIHDIVLHLADSEAHGYIRSRRCIAEPGQAVMAYDEHQWAAALRYHEQHIEDALDLFKLLRERTFQRWPMEQVAQLLPNASFAMLAGADHHLWVSHAEELRVSFIRQSAAGSRRT